VAEVLVVTSLGCTPCTRAKRILKELQTEIPTLSISEVEFTSAAGTKLATENAILYPPAVFMNGALIAKGKIDAEKMVSTIRRMNSGSN
jgi:predicted thioredoxin/glutaredoxin